MKHLNNGVFKILNNKEQASRNSEKQEIKGDKNRKTRNRGALVPKSLNLHISSKQSKIGS